MVGEYDALNSALWSFQEMQALSAEEEFARSEVAERIQQTICRVCPGASLKPYGSQATGLQTRSSDIDLGFVFPPHVHQHFVQQHPQNQRTMVQQVLFSLENELKVHDWMTTPILQASVPIVKCTDMNTGLQCDISHLEPNALVNANHIRRYTRVDPRVRPLLLAIKYWAKQRGINDASQGTLNSFGYCLMTIQYLQMCDPPILPVLDVQETVQIEPSMLLPT